MAAIKDKGLEFHSLVSGMGKSREISLALTKIEEAVMWGVKHLTACLLVAVVLGLSGCAAIQVAGQPVTPQQVIVAANAFDALEATATVYLRLPLCPQAQLCRNAAASHAIVAAIRAGRSARNELEREISPGSTGLVSTTAYNVLTTTLKTLNGVYLQYGIGS